MYEKVLASLISAGIDRVIAESMAKSMTKPVKEKKKKGYTGPRRTKAKMEVEAVLRCVTCNTKTTVTRIVEAYPDSVPTLESIVGLCPNCIKNLYNMTKEELVSLIVIHNHTDISLKKLSLKEQIKLSKRYTPQELFHKTY